MTRLWFDYSNPRNRAVIDRPIEVGATTDLDVPHHWADDLLVGQRYIAHLEDCCMRAAFMATLLHKDEETLIWDNGVVTSHGGRFYDPDQRDHLRRRTLDDWIELF